MDWTELNVDTRSPVPIYRQVHDRIAEWIRKGHLAHGEKLLPTRELAGLLGLNRTTVAAAYEILEKEGLLQGQVGRGSYVCAPERRPALDWESRFRAGGADRELHHLIWPAEAACINFSTSRPDGGTFSSQLISDAAEEELRSQGDKILQLGAAEGYAPLREFLLSEMRRAGIAKGDDEVLVTSGCQQGLDLIAKVLVSPGDPVLIEDPVYPGARDLFLSAGAEVRGIPVGPAGLSIPELEQELSRRGGGAKPRLLVATPNFQNPTGTSLPLEARRELLRLAARFQLAIVENDVYAGLRYRGEELPSLKAIDSDGRVLYLRSFSKIAFPGLRVGWCVAPRIVARRLRSAKQLSDLHTDQLSQAVLYRLSVDGSLARHARAMLEKGGQRLEAAVKACRAEMPAGVEFYAPEGGMHLWLQAPPPLDSGELLARARAERVLFIPGRFFSVSRPHSRALRLSFASLPPEQIRRGVAILAKLIRAQAPAPAASSDGVPALV
jgi:2-aminoadipate transaminase